MKGELRIVFETGKDPVATITGDIGPEDLLNMRVTMAMTYEKYRMRLRDKELADAEIARKARETKEKEVEENKKVVEAQKIVDAQKVTPANIPVVTSKV